MSSIYRGCGCQPPLHFMEIYMRTIALCCFPIKVGHKRTKTMAFHLTKGPVYCTCAVDKGTWLIMAALWDTPSKGRILGVFCVLSPIFL